MIDISKQVDYWRTGAVDDWQVAVELVNAGRTRHGLFFAHLALSEEQRIFLARFDRYQLEGRYPDRLPFGVDAQTARDELRQAREVFEWLSRQL
jgi:hypothetical protein